jgi:hypothetical protein
MAWQRGKDLRREGGLFGKRRDSADIDVHSKNYMIVSHKLNTNIARHLLPTPGLKTPTVHAADID